MSVEVRYPVDPELAAFVAAQPTGDFRDIEGGRAFLTRLLETINAATDTEGVTIRDELVPGLPGAPDVPVRVFVPKTRATAGLVFDIHGGAFTHGHLDADHAANVALARDLGVVVVSVDYRLAPEAVAPAALEDCFAALAWAVGGVAGLDVDPARVVVHGGSAGGGLAAGLALLARDRGGPRIAFQFLNIPVLDDRLDTPSMRSFTDTPMWSRPQAEFSWDCYLGAGRRGTDLVSPYAAPARATDLSGLPPAYVAVMEFDPLRDEGIAYAQRLLAAGVRTELHLFPGTFHGSALFVPAAAISERYRAEQRAVMGRVLGA